MEKELTVFKETKDKSISNRIILSSVLEKLCNPKYG